MLSLRSISLIAVAACATLSSALPLNVGQLGALLPNVPGIPGIPTAGNLPIPSVPLPLPVRRNEGIQSFPEICTKASTSMKPILLDLEAAVSVKVELIDKVAVVAHLNDIVAVLRVAVGDLQVLVSATPSLSVLLTLNGVVLTVQEAAQLVFSLLQSLLEALCLVVKITGLLDVQISLCLTTICGVLVQFLSISLSLVVGLKVCLGGLVGSLVANIQLLGFVDIFAVLGLSVS